MLRAQAALSLVDRARALPQPAAPANDRGLDRRWLLAGGGAAAVAVVGAGLGGVALLGRKPVEIVTHRGELRRVPLEDGSLAEVNTDSRLAVTMAKRLRRVQLQQGEAWFAVAKDAARPFVVEAAELRVAAVGTAFAVCDAGERLEVQVTEGVVEAWRRQDKATRVRIAAGSRLSVSRDGRFTIAEATDAIARDLAWRSGQIDLAGRTVAEAVAEFNRYNRRQIALDDPAVGRESLVGLFRTSEAESFAQAVAQTFGVPVSETPDLIRIGA